MARTTMGNYIGHTGRSTGPESGASAQDQSKKQKERTMFHEITPLDCHASTFIPAL
jgi:hypothetical protein